MFEDVMCGNLIPSIMIFENLHVLEKHYTCPINMELHNLTTSDEISYTQFCETRQIGTSTPESTTSRTDISFTRFDFNISQSTTLENEALLTNGNSNSIQIIYIVAPAGGVFLISLIIISIVCLRKRVKDPEILTDDIKMKRETKQRKDNTSFKGEMIENELYKRADDVLDCDSNGDNIQAMMGDFSATRSLKENTRTQLKVDQDEYSYPCKISKCNEERLNVAFDDDTDDDLDVKARDIFQTPNHDSENACQYAVVNKSRKI